MLHGLRIRNFKSLRDVDVQLPRLTVIFGPNGTGKTTFLEAIQALAHMGASRTLEEALAASSRGEPEEVFTFPGGDGEERASTFSLEAELGVADRRYRYRVEVGREPSRGGLVLVDEYLARLNTRGEPRGNPAIERVGRYLRIRRKGKGSHPWQEAGGLNHALLSNRRFAGPGYQTFDRIRTELATWRRYHLAPGAAQAPGRLPSEVHDIGSLGQDLAPFLYRMNAEHPGSLQEVVRLLRLLVPDVVDVEVALDPRHGGLALGLRRAGRAFPVPLLSEGTLRLMALCAIVANPWPTSLVAIDEPENGLHPRRVELVAQLLMAFALERDTQVVVTTHSPLFCAAVVETARARPEEIALLLARPDGTASAIERFDVTGPLFGEHEIAAAMGAASRDGRLEGVLFDGGKNG